MNRQVMVVDDDPDVLFTVKSVLENAGLSVVTATGGKACLDELKNGFKGVILLDIMMPEMNGWEVVKAMIDGGYVEGTIICMLTARHVPDPILSEFTHYVLEYIRKPFDAHILTKTVKEYLSYLEC